jgi:hypothetical protein
MQNKGELMDIQTNLGSLTLKSLLGGSLLLLLLGAAAPVYEEDFDKGLPAGVFSHDRQKLEIFTAPKGEKVLGRLGPGKLQMHLDKLPPHQALRISFDLCFSGSWDGTAAGYGPDIWACGPKGGLPLLETSFNNCHKVFDDNIWQNFPDNYRAAQVARIMKTHTGEKFNKVDARVEDLLHRGGSGAFDHGHLGCTWNRLGTDVRYRLCFHLRHRAESLDFLFDNRFEEDVNGQWWALDKIKVECQEEIPPLAENERERLWLDLLSEDAMRALIARDALSLHPEAVRMLLDRHFPPSRDLDLGHLIKDLEKAGTAREEAIKTLREAGPILLQQLEDLRRLHASSSPESAAQLDFILADWRKIPAPEWTVRQLWRMADLARISGCAEGMRIGQEMDARAALLLSPETKP